MLVDFTLVIIQKTTNCAFLLFRELQLVKYSIPATTVQFLLFRGLLLVKYSSQATTDENNYINILTLSY